MKLNILKDKLKEGVGIVVKISQKSLTLPILQNTLLVTEKNFLRLSVTNLESAINWWGLSKTEKEGQICIPTRFFSNLIAFLPNKPVSLEVKNQVLNLECENYKTKIKGLSAEDFPIIPQVKEGEMVTVDNLAFCNSLNQVLRF